MNNCYKCKNILTENDCTLCTMNCCHVLCQTCFEHKIINNTFKCDVCETFTANVVERIGNNLVVATPLPQLGTCNIDKHYDQWMDVWKELTKEQPISLPKRKLKNKIEKQSNKR